MNRNECSVSIDKRSKLMDKILSVIGIILVMIGTVFSLWSILSTKVNYYGTCKWFSNLPDD